MDKLLNAFEDGIITSLQNVDSVIAAGISESTANYLALLDQNGALTSRFENIAVSGRNNVSTSNKELAADIMLSNSAIAKRLEG